MRARCAHGSGNTPNVESSAPGVGIAARGTVASHPAPKNWPQDVALLLGTLCDQRRERCWSASGDQAVLLSRAFGSVHAQGNCWDFQVCDRVPCSVQAMLSKVLQPVHGMWTGSGDGAGICNALSAAPAHCLALLVASTNPVVAGWQMRTQTCTCITMHGSTLKIGYRGHQLTTWTQNTLIWAKKWYFLANKLNF